MRTHILRTTHRPISDDVARRRLLGLVVLALTLTGGYALAQRGVMPAAFVQFAEDADAADAVEDADDAGTRPTPTTAEILAHIAKLG